MVADLDCAGGQEMGCTYIPMFGCPGTSCLSVHPGRAPLGLCGGDQRKFIFLF